MFTCTYFMNDSVAWRNFTYNMHATRKQLHVWSYDHTTRKGFRNLDSQESKSWLLVFISTVITIWNHYILLSYTTQTSAPYFTFMNKHLQYTCKYIMHNHPFTLYQWRERVRRNHAVLMDSFKFHENNVPREQKAQVKKVFKEYSHINHW